MRIRRLYRGAVLLTGILSVVAACGAYGLHLLRRLDLNTVDMHFAIRGAQRPPSDVIVVKVDATTFDELNQQWPFPRGDHARVIENLKRDGAKVIAYDVQFTEPSADPNQDNELINAVRHAGNVVLATTETCQPTRRQPCPDGPTHVFGGSQGALAYSRGVAADSNFPEDPGGVFRRTAYSIGGVTTFPVAAAEMALARRIHGPGNSTWIDFHGPPGTIRSVSFSRVVRGHFAPGTFRGKVVVVGATAPSLQDRHPTSTTGDDPMAGPEIQASAIDTALRGFPLRTADGWLEVALIIAFGLLTPLAALRMSAFRALALTAAAIAAFAVLTQVAFDGGTIVSFVYPALAALLSAGITAVLYGVTVAFEREQVRDAFARFVPEAVVGQVLAQADGLRLGGVRRDCTVLFSDLRGFTSFAEQLEPDLVIEVLNRYLTEMSDAILDHGGTLVAYMGDGIMAVFGAPIEQSDHALRALGAGREMLLRLDRFNAWLRAEGHGDGFKMGIGLNSGPVMSGNVGSERRLEYTAIGDTTNTAARLEGMTKGTPHQIYIADTTRAQINEPDGQLAPAGEFEVRGRKGKVRLWTLAEVKLENSQELRV